MIIWLCLWQLFIYVGKYGMYEAKPVASAKPFILEVFDGETAQLYCPSNDNNHRFQFWQLKSNQILGPGNKIDGHKYIYEVLSGTLHIKAVSSDEQGIYTCFCKHLFKRTYSAKSILLIIKSDWQQLWEKNEVNFFRLGVLFLVTTIIIMVLYMIYNNIKHDQLMQYKDFTNENILNKITSRKVSYSLLETDKDIELEERIDNPELEVQSSGKSTLTFGYTRLEHSKL